MIKLAAPTLAVLTALTLLHATTAAATPNAATPSEPGPAGLATTQEACADRGPPPSDPPVLAHFYSWFTTSSWNRAKKDFPRIGRYSSDQVTVMRTQAEQARAAGIDGLIVSWKSTDTLNRRLAALRDVAASHDLALAITYQAQDFNRNPLPAMQVRSDLEEFVAAYADDPVFHLFGTRPVVAISGTWHYSLDDLQFITAPVASRLTLLATEKNVEGYERVASAFDGDLYYWSSADPQRNSRHREKLQAMADVVRGHCGIWVAPVAPGFDARDVGGRSVVDRRDGETLRLSWDAALATNPDAVGVISWNEYSENTHIEPSTGFGTRYLDVLSELTGAKESIAAGEVDSSGPRGNGTWGRGLLTISVLLASVLLVTVLGMWRRRHQGDLPWGR
jgi:hypothetical protein